MASLCHTNIEIYYKICQSAINIEALNLSHRHMKLLTTMKGS